MASRTGGLESFIVAVGTEYSSLMNYVEFTFQMLSKLFSEHFTGATMQNKKLPLAYVQ
jgi:hypothetical protein